MIKTYAEANNEREMLTGNLNRMKLTKDLTELESMHAWAVKRVDRLYMFYAEELRKEVTP
jgi:hypothetical protein